MIQFFLGADIQKALDSSVSRAFGLCRGVDMHQNITVMAGKQARSLDTAHIVVCIDAAYISVFAFNRYNRNLKACQLHGWNRMAENNQSLDFIGKQLLDIAAFGFFIIVADK